jgi:hypothetical protein
MGGNVMPAVGFDYLEFAGADSIGKDFLGFAKIAHGQLPDGGRSRVPPGFRLGRAGVKVRDSACECADIIGGKVSLYSQIVESLIVRQAPHLNGELNRITALFGNLARAESAVPEDYRDNA